jgi:magnesium chelatase subunit D
MALNRINQAKGALAHLLKQSYVRRDHVAIVSFHEDRARVLLPPSQSVTRARHILDALCVGGSTPLAAGLFSSLEIARRARRSGAPEQMVLLLFTDGRANVSLRAGDVTLEPRARQRLIGREIEQLGAALRRAGVASVVIDTQNRFVSGGEGKKLAGQLGGRYIYFGSNGTAGSEQLSALSLEVTGQRR